MLKQLSKISTVLIVSLIITACGSNKKTVSMNVQSDPLGAYALMQVKYKGNEDADWIFLGPTPINQDKKVVLKDASTVSLKVIRPGFYEQVKSWKAKRLLKRKPPEKWHYLGSEYGAAIKEELFSLAIDD